MRIGFHILFLLVATLPGIALAQISPIVWDKTYGGTATDGFGQLSVQRMIWNQSKTNWWIGGASNSNQGGSKTENARGDTDYWVLKLDLNGNLVWDKTYGAQSREGHPKLIEMANGDLIWVGSSNSQVSGDKTLPNKQGNIVQHFDAWILRTDQNGNKLGEFVLGGEAFDAVWDGIQTQDGNIVLLCQTSSPASFDVSGSPLGGADIWLVKVTPTGTPIWNTRLGGSGEDIGLELVEMANGDLMMIGHTNSPISGNITEAGRGGIDYWVNCVASNGTPKWNKRFGGSKDDLGIAIAASPNEVWIAGNSNSDRGGEKSEDSRGDQDFWVLRLDTDGNLLDDKTIGGPDFDELHDLLINCTGQIWIGGVSASGIGGDKSDANKGILDMWIAKLSPDMAILNDQTFGGTGYDQLSSFLEYPTGGIILGGLSDSPISGDKSEPSFGSFDFWVTRIKVKSRFEVPDTLCAGESAIFLNQSTRIADSYEWNFGDPASGNSNSSTVKDPVHQFNVPGTYWVQLIAKEGCDQDTSLQKIVVIPSLTAAFSWNSNFPTTDQELIFTNQSTGATQYQWNLGDGTFTTQFEPQHTYAEDGVYAITLSAKDPLTGCESTHTETITIQSIFQVFIPNAFTPNGDGINDHFRVQTPLVQTFSIRIYDRWGKVIFTQQGPEIDWDGKGMGAPMPEGVYPYEGTAIHQNGDVEKIAGSITLIR